jgi:hypothetical protein
MRRATLAEGKIRSFFKIALSFAGIYRIVFTSRVGRCVMGVAELRGIATFEPKTLESQHSMIRSDEFEQYFTSRLVCTETMVLSNRLSSHLKLSRWTNRSDLPSRCWLRMSLRGGVMSLHPAKSISLLS